MPLGLSSQSCVYYVMLFFPWKKVEFLIFLVLFSVEMRKTLGGRGGGALKL